MAWSWILTHRIKNKSINKTVFSKHQFAALFLAALFASQGFGAFWSGEGEDNLWDNPENWSGDPATSNVFLDAAAERNNGPLIEDGIDAVTKSFFAGDGKPNMSMTGGSLDVTGKGVFWGEFGTATFEMSGGVVNLTGSPGVLVMGEQSTVDAPRSSIGIWEMTGGELNVAGIEMPGDGQRGVGEIELYGGTINVGSRELKLFRGADIDITEGVLVLDGDQRSDIETYIEEGWMEGYGGDAELSVVFAGGRTTVTAVDPNPSIPGDYNGNGLLDTGDLDLQASEGIAKQDLDYDINGNGIVDTADRVAWTNDLKNTWMGDADLDGVFGSGDLVNVFAAAKYETGQAANWEQGDWNGDQIFGSGDLVTAFSNAGYEAGPRPGGPNPATAVVPEPSSIVLLLIGGLFALRHRNRS